MSNKDLLVGQVVTCSDFAAGKKSGDGTIGVGVEDGEIKKITGKEKTWDWLDADERVKIAAKTGKDPGEKKTELLYDAFDKSRAKAEFVVIEVRVDSSSGSGGSSRTQLVFAQRLVSNGKYDLKGEIIFFNWNFYGHFPFTVRNLKIVRKMERVLI